MSELVAYFGFGSLVNRHTLRTRYVDIIPARLKGWRRHWQARTSVTGEEVALLSIHRDDACIIDGMIVIDHLENLPQVDEREAGYSRHALTSDDVELLSGVKLPDQFYVYVANVIEGADEGGPLLQSYLDAVMQGFRNEYGDEGVSRFVETTVGFQRTILTDRIKPIYPRSVSLDDTEISLFDTALKKAGVLGF